MRIDPALCQKILIAVEADPMAGTGQFIRPSIEGYDQTTVAQHVKYLCESDLVTGQDVTHMNSPYPEIMVKDITAAGRRYLHDREPGQRYSSIVREAKKLMPRLSVTALECGGQGRNRTADASLFRAALYRLSYLAVSLKASV